MVRIPLTLVSRTLVVWISRMPSAALSMLESATFRRMKCVRLVFIRLVRRARKVTMLRPAIVLTLLTWVMLNRMLPVCYMVLVPLCGTMLRLVRVL